MFLSLTLEKIPIHDLFFHTLAVVALAVRCFVERCEIIGVIWGETVKAN